MRILHVDDSNFQRRLAKKFIEAAFPEAELLSVSDSEMLELTYSEGSFDDIDLVITDLLMEKISGHDVIKSIRQYNDICFIAVLSSNIQEAEKEKSYSLGADYFIEKPLTAQKLQEVKVLYDSGK